MKASWIDPDVKPIEGREPISKALGWLKGESSARPVITEGGVAKGIVNVRAFSARSVDEERQVRKVMFPVPVLSPDDDLVEIGRRFTETLAPYLPVADGKRVVGCVPAAGPLEAFDEGPKARDLVMEVPTIGRTDTLERALHLFGDTNVQALPVVDDGRLVGALARAHVLRVQDFGRRHIGRMDRAGQRTDNRADPVEGWMEGGWSEVHPDSGYDEVVAALQTADPVYVVGPRGRYHGTVSAPQVWRSVTRHPVGVAWVRGG